MHKQSTHQCKSRSLNSAHPVELKMVSSKWVRHFKRDHFKEHHNRLQDCAERRASPGARPGPPAQARRKGELGCFREPCRGRNRHYTSSSCNSSSSKTPNQASGKATNRKLVSSSRDRKASKEKAKDNVDSARGSRLLQAPRSSNKDSCRRVRASSRFRTSSRVRSLRD